jgi:hypothetical protein
MATAAPFTWDAGHIEDDDGICWCNPTLEYDDEELRVWVHHFEGAVPQAKEAAI